ncbi:hypothetical protein HOP50_16g77230 [Chloropicon primus]|nr:hypothetical protein HOP50_16g77230 [Chloropicon primus]
MSRNRHSGGGKAWSGSGGLVPLLAVVVLCSVAPLARCQFDFTIVGAGVMDWSYLDAALTHPGNDIAIGNTGFAELMVRCERGTTNPMQVQLPSVDIPDVWYDNLDHHLGTWTPTSSGQSLYCEAWECDNIIGCANGELHHAAPNPGLGDDYMGIVKVDPYDFRGDPVKIYTTTHNGANKVALAIRCDYCYTWAQSQLLPNQKQPGIGDTVNAPSSGGSQKPNQHDAGALSNGGGAQASSSKPVVTLRGDKTMYVRQGDPFNDPGVTAADSADGDVTSSVYVVGSVDPNTVGTYRLRYVATNSQGERGFKIRIVEVVPSDSPSQYDGLFPTNPPPDVPPQQPNSNNNANPSTGTGTGGQANNNNGGTPSSGPQSSPTAGNNPASGNQGGGSPSSTPPSSSPPSNQQPNSNNNANPSTGTGTGGQANNNNGGTPSSGPQSSPTVGNTQNNAGQGGGAQASSSAPVVTLRGDKTMYVRQGDPFNDPGVTAADSADGDVTSSVYVVGSVDPNTVGTYRLRYVATDSEGERGFKIRIVEVLPRDESGAIPPPSGSPSSGPAAPNQQQPSNDDEEDDGLFPTNPLPGVPQQQPNSNNNANPSTGTGTGGQANNNNGGTPSSGPQSSPTAGNNPASGNQGGGSPSSTPPSSSPPSNQQPNSNNNANPSTGTGTGGQANNNNGGTPSSGPQSSPTVGNTQNNAGQGGGAQASSSAPVVTLRGDKTMYVRQGDPFNDPGVTAADSADGDVTSSVYVVGSVDPNTVGTYRLRYVATDSEGERGFKIRIVEVLPRDESGAIPPPSGSPSSGPAAPNQQQPSNDDEEDDGLFPTNPLPGVPQQQPNSNNNNANPSTGTGTGGQANNNNGGTPSSGPQSSPTAGNNPASGNQGGGSPSSTPPSSSPPSNQQPNSNNNANPSTGTGTGGQANNNNGGTPSSGPQSSPTVGNTQNNAGQGGGAQASSSAPVVTLRGDKTMYVRQGDPFNDPGVTAADSADGDVTSSVYVVGSVDPNTVGTYRLRYVATDSEGERGFKIRIVEVLPRDESGAIPPPSGSPSSGPAAPNQQQPSNDDEEDDGLFPTNPLPGVPQQQPNSNNNNANPSTGTGTGGQANNNNGNPHHSPRHPHRSNPGPGGAGGSRNGHRVPPEHGEDGADDPRSQEGGKKGGVNKVALGVSLALIFAALAVGAGMYWRRSRMRRLGHHESLGDPHLPAFRGPLRRIVVDSRSKGSGPGLTTPLEAYYNPMKDTHDHLAYKSGGEDLDVLRARNPGEVARGYRDEGTGQPIRSVVTGDWEPSST